MMCGVRGATLTRAPAAPHSIDAIRRLLLQVNTLVATAMVAADAPDGALGDALAIKLAGRAPVFVMAFASVSSARALASVIDVLRARFPGAVVVGASTSGELIESGDAERSISAAAICGAFEAHAMLGRDLRAGGVGVFKNPERNSQ